MASSGYLVSPTRDPSNEKLWNETWKRIDRFLPDLRSDLALDEPAPEGEQEEARDAEEPVKNGAEAPGNVADSSPEVKKQDAEEA